MIARSLLEPEADASAISDELATIPEEGQSTEKSERKLAKLWKKATRKFASEPSSSSNDAAAAPSPEDESSERFYQAKQREDEVVLTQETDDHVEHE